MLLPGSAGCSLLDPCAGQIRLTVPCAACPAPGFPGPRRVRAASKLQKYLEMSSVVESIPNVDERITGAIARVLDAEPHSLSDFGMDAYLSDLGLNSMKVVELLLEIESEFEVTLPDELLVAETFRTAANLKAAVARAQHAQG